MSKYTGSSYSSISEKQRAQSKKWAEDLNRHFSKKDILQVVQLPSFVRLLAIPWTAARQAPLSFTVSLRVMLSDHLILCCPLFFFFHQFFPASGSFPISWLFASGGQSIGASASASVLPMNNQDWFPLRLTGLISLLMANNEKKLNTAYH